ncbi:MAG: hypothetical protein ACTSYF_09995 [Promethearchaeota archaeon]
MTNFGRKRKHRDKFYFFNDVILSNTRFKTIYNGIVYVNHAEIAKIKIIPSHREYNIYFIFDHWESIHEQENKFKFEQIPTIMELINVIEIKLGYKKIRSNKKAKFFTRIHLMGE